MKKLFFICVAVVLITGAIFSGCAKQTTTTPTTTKPQTTTSTTIPTVSSTTTTTTTATPTTAVPQFGGTLKVISNPGITNIGYPGEVNASNDGSYRQPALETLLGYSTDGKGTVVPLLATAFQYNTDYTTLTLTLRKGVKFHDGTDFNAAAAKICLDMVLNSKGVANLATVSSIDAVDEYTIRLNLKTYDSALLTNLADYGCPMVSPTSLTKLGKDASLFHPVGTGPFKFVSYTRDVSLKYEKFADYWQKPKPYLDGLEFNLISDPVTQLASLKAGEAQMMRAIGSSDASDLQKTGKFQLNPQEVATDCLAMDSANASSPFSNLKVRQAVAYSLDNTAIAKATGRGFFLPNNQLISPLDFGYNPDIVGYPYNVDKAKQLLKEAGYPTGFDTTLSYRAGAFESDFCNLVQGYLKPAGINAQIVLADAARFNDLRYNGWKGMLMYVFPAGAEKDMSAQFRQRLSSKNTIYPPTTLYIPADYNTKVQAINIERDDAKRKALLQEVSKMAIDTYCLVVPVQVEMGISASSIQVMGSDMYVKYAMFYHPENIWLSK
jgi:peptide/nickel transport system substrate-binding protein